MLMGVLISAASRKALSMIQGRLEVDVAASDINLCSTGRIVLRSLQHVSFGIVAHDTQVHCAYAAVAAAE
jgi:hypothetical protein